MRGNVLGPVDKTVNVLIDRSYPVVKEVYLQLDKLKSVYDSLDAIEYNFEHKDAIANIQTASNNLIRIHQSIEALDNINDNLNSINKVYAALDEIKVIYENIDVLSKAEDLATEILDYRDAAKSYADQAGKYYQSVINVIDDIKVEKDKSIEEVWNTANTKKKEILEIVGTYYKPSIDEKGNLSWENTGGKPNPLPVNIKGPKGDTGTGLNILGQFPSYDDLIAAFPEGSEGDAYQLVDTGEVWIWDINQKSWVNLGVLQGGKGEQGEPGLSANEILMNPDPVDYFDQIYGTTDLVTGDLVVDITGTEPDATDIFEEALE